MDQIKKCNCHEKATGFSLTVSLLLDILFTSSVHNGRLSFSFGREPWQMSHYIYKQSIAFGVRLSFPIAPALSFTLLLSPAS